MNTCVLCGCEIPEQHDACWPCFEYLITNPSVEELQGEEEGGVSEPVLRISEEEGHEQTTLE